MVDSNALNVCGSTDAITITNPLYKIGNGANTTIHGKRLSEEGSFMNHAQRPICCPIAVVNGCFVAWLAREYEDDRRRGEYR